MSITIEQLQTQLQQLVRDRESYAQAFQQTSGAINLIQAQINMVLAAQQPKEPVPEPKADEPLPQESLPPSAEEHPVLEPEYLGE